MLLADLQIEATLVIILAVNAVSGGCIVRYQCLFPTVVLAQNFVVVIRERPTVVFAASPVVIFRTTYIRTVNVVKPGTHSFVLAASRMRGARSSRL